MEDKISDEEKSKRLQILNKKVNAYALEANKKLIGKTVEVLIIDKSEKGEDKVCGYTDTMKLVNVIGKEDLIGKIIKVKITDAKSFSLDGIMLDN